MFFAIMPILLLSCSNDDVTNCRDVQFRFNLTSALGNQVISHAENARVILILDQLSGENATIIRQQTKFSNTGEGFITEPIKLKAGEYAIKSLILIDNESQLVYTLPKTSAPSFGSEDTHHFTVFNSEKVANFSFGMIEATAGSDIYNTVLLTSIKIGVYIQGGITPTLTTATVSLLYNDVPVCVYQVEARINRLDFPNDPAKTYLLKVEKQGYVTYTRDIRMFTYVEEQKMPLRIVLSPLN
jgi:hypothetical protein